MNWFDNFPYLYGHSKNFEFKKNVAAFDINGGYNEKTQRFAAYANCLIAVKL